MTNNFETERQQFDELGYVILRGLFSANEMDHLLKFAKQDARLSEQATARKDAAGKQTKLALWNETGNDLYSAFASCPRIVKRMEAFLCGEVYLYHMKMMLKEPLVGGAWEWHQDYGYWYANGCLAPLMASCLIAVTPSNPANGCLQVIPKSHRLGRVDHGKTGDQTGADLERVTVAEKKFGLEYVSADPGDALFFHSNLLHRSDANSSDDPRWSLICCYNAARNDPYKESRHPRYTPLTTGSDSAILDFSF
jgi:ectoine hydroxylase